jgi:phytanoyl-CoA hydroxylase
MADSTSKLVEVGEEQRAQLANAGFFITDILFDEETLAPVRRLFDEIAAPMDENRAGGVFAYALHDRSEVCRTFLRHPVFAALCSQLLGPTVFQSWNQMIFKRPGTSGNFAWHQDGYYGAYNPDGTSAEGPENIDVTGNITFWVALTPATTDNGCLWALPGGHKKGLLPHRWNEERKEWVGTYDTSEEVPAEMNPGQILVFNRLTPHRSGANTTADQPRIGYQVGYGIEPGPYDQLPFLADGEIIGTPAG